MTAALMVTAVGLATGAPVAATGLLAAALMAPLPTAAVLLVLAANEARHHRRIAGRTREVMILITIASELRAGQSLRLALVSSAERDPTMAGASRSAMAGRPIGEVAEAMAEAMGRYGAMTGAALRVTARSGGALAPIFDELAAQVMALDDLHRERRAAMAPAVLQGAIVGGTPLVALVWMLVSGRLISLVQTGPVQAGLVVGGFVLVLAGSIAVVTMAVRGSR